MKGPMHFSFILAVLLSAAALSGCRAVVVSDGDARISLKLGGVIAKPMKTAGPSRLIFHGASALQISFSAADYQRSEHYLLADIATDTVSVSGLPYGKELTVTIQSFDAAGNLLSGWSEISTLKAGDNELAATLAPQIAPTELTSVSDNSSPVTLASSISIENGATVFYKIPLSVSDSYTQILFDTGKAQWVHMDLYDSAWNAINPTAFDADQGWAVLKPPSDGVVYVVLSNTVDSIGYPAGTVSGALQARRTWFVSASGSGDGLSPDTALSLVSNYTLSGSGTWLIAAGSYSPPNTVITSGAVDVRLYGGFNPSNWAERDPAAWPTKITNAGTIPTASFSFYTGSSGAADGLSLYGGKPTSSASNQGIAVETTGAVVVSNCILSGYASTDYLIIPGMNINSDGLFANGAVNLEVSNCSITGGCLYATTNSGSGTTIGVYLYTTNPPYIHDCEISGGIVNTSGSGITATCYGTIICSGAVATFVRCRIWGGQATADASSSTTYGIYQSSTVNGSLIANSVISGGAAAGTATPASVGIRLGSGKADVVGCTIDGGISGIDTSFTPGTISQSIAFSASGTTTTSVCGNLFLVSGTTVATREDLLLTSAAFSSFSDNAGISAPAAVIDSTSYTDFGGVTATIAGGTVVDSARLPATEFEAYTGAPVDYASFLAVDWRPSAGASFAGSLEASTAADWGLSSSSLLLYPALALDLAGNSRSLSTPWHRGAYE